MSTLNHRINIIWKPCYFIYFLFNSIENRLSIIISIRVIVKCCLFDDAQNVYMFNENFIRKQMQHDANATLVCFLD